MQASDYTQVIGIILGMGLMGYVGDMIGRKWGSVTTACVMFVGGVLLTCLDGVNEKGLAIMYIVAQFVFGFGVGGEYPMAAGSAAERAEAGGKAKASKRGREVLLTFSMQVGLNKVFLMSSHVAGVTYTAKFLHCQTIKIGGSHGHVCMHF